jgi:heat shock protein HslJ
MMQDKHRLWVYDHPWQVPSDIKERTMKIWKMAVLAAAVLALAACRPVTREGAAMAPMPDDAAVNALAGTSWTLATLNGEAPLADTEVTATFGADGSLAGSDGCNRYSTQYKVDGDSITINPNGISTMMACPEPQMTQASAFMAALGSAATFSLEDGNLSLIDSAGTTVATFAPVSSDLAGTSWNVTNYNNGKEAVVGLVADTTITLVFGDSGQISGSSGCNSFSGTYTSDGAGSIEIGQLASTMMACVEPQGLMEQEAQFLAALPLATSYRVEGNVLDLRSADGAMQVRAEAAPAAAASGDAGAATTGDTGVSSSDGMAGMASVTGTVTYLQRMALPPDAMIEVSIHNKQLADAPPEMTLLGMTAFAADGNQVPLPYTVVYSPEDVREGDMYSIGATIRDGSGNLMFVSDTMIPVITLGNPTADVEILVRSAQ